MQFRRVLRISVAAAVVLAGLLGGPLRADVQPGDVINAANADKVADLVSPGVMWCLKHGLVITVAPYKRVEWNAAYKIATEKYSAQVKLSPDGRRLIDWIAGMPFPSVDANDPQAAIKIMFNYDRRPYWQDDLDLRNFDSDTGTINDDAPLTVERHFLVDHLRSLNYIGRVVVDPKPEMPNPNGVHNKGSLHPVLEPFDLKGVGSLSFRYIDPDRQDDTWLYLPSLRRVRRLSSAQRSDALFGQDTDVDSYGGYAGHPAWNEYKFLGEKEILGSYHSEEFPVKWCPNNGDYLFCDKWEKRKAWVIEATSKLPQYAYGKRLIFIDKETYFVAYSDIFDRSMQLWKVWINQWSFKKRATSSYGDIYPDEMPFNPSITMVDIQLRHATHASLPSMKFEGEQGWYMNQGAKAGLTEDFFTIAHMIETGH